MFGFGKSKRNRPAAQKGKVPQGAGAAPRKRAPIDWSRFFTRTIGFCLLVVWLLLWSNFYRLQVIMGPEYSARAERQHNVFELVQGKRGSIFDRNGNVLASSVESSSIFARIPEIEDIPATAARLEAILGVPKDKIRKRLESATGFVWVERKVSDKVAAQVMQENIKGVHLQKEYARVYPYKHLAGQLLGFVNTDNVGIDGTEARFEKVLRGKELKRVVQRDARGNRIYTDGAAETANLSGSDIYLTLDVQVQYFAENAIYEAVTEYAARWGGCLVVDVESGDILAVAHYPFFNPNSYRSSSNFVRRNKLALDALEQGSTIKPFVVAAALQEHTIKPDTVFDCENGSWVLNGKVIRDTRPYKALTVEKILRYSSNIGSAKIGLGLGGKRYGSYLQRLGYGSRTGLPLIGESPGIMRDPARWPETDVASSAFGQSFSATGLQMAQAYLCLTNNGLKKPLQLIRKGAERLPASNDQIFSPEVANTTMEMLRLVVESSDGGGRRAKINGVESGGKTGTAQKAEKGSYGEKRVASFVGYAPADKPKYLVITIVDEPTKNQYGGMVAAPVFRNVVAQTLAYSGFMPDIDPAAAAELAPLVADPARYAQMMAQMDAQAKSRKVLDRVGVAGISASADAELVRDVNFASPVLKAPEDAVPDVTGLLVRDAIDIFSRNGTVPLVKGRGSKVIKQLPQAGSPWPRANYAESVLWVEDGI